MIIKKEVDYAKEIGEVLDLVTEIIKVIKEKGDYTSLIDDLIKAVEGIDEIPEEIKFLAPVITTVGHAAGNITELFLKKEEK